MPCSSCLAADTGDRDGYCGQVRPVTDPYDYCIGSTSSVCNGMGGCCQAPGGMCATNTECCSAVCTMGTCS